MSETKEENALDMSLRVDIKNVLPSSATIIRQRIRDTLENSVKILRKMDPGGKPEDD